jgi:adenylate cyclase class IV
MPRNIEIKAKLNGSIEALLPRTEVLAGAAAEVIAQDDSFFHVPHGRLKLRQFADGTAELIHYHRADTADAKASDYVRVAVHDAAALREALARGCGLLGRVRKTRWLVVVHEQGFATRIHLDRVEGLGDYMELEVMLQDGQTDSAGQQVADALMQRLGLESAARLAGAYMDLLAAARLPAER